MLAYIAIGFVVGYIGLAIVLGYLVDWTLKRKRRVEK